RTANRYPTSPDNAPTGDNALRLLVVEDDPDLNRQLTTALTDAGYVVDRAFDGEEGHYLGESEPYDAVILDIGLPKMDGISVLESWRRTGRTMPVLMLTARVAVDGNPVKLTSHEYRLLAYLMHHSGRVVSRTELVEHLYDQDFDRDSNTIEVFVGRIRKKLGVEIIQTVRGLGYLLNPPDAR